MKELGLSWKQLELIGVGKIFFFLISSENFLLLSLLRVPSCLQHCNPNIEGYI